MSTKRVIIDMTEEQYNEYMDKKGKKTHRQALLGAFGIDANDLRVKQVSYLAEKTGNPLIKEFFEKGLDDLSMMSTMRVADDPVMHRELLENLLDAKLEGEKITAKLAEERKAKYAKLAADAKTEERADIYKKYMRPEKTWEADEEDPLHGMYGKYRHVRRGGKK